MPIVSIVGSGMVGTSVGKGLLHLGHDVAFYDTNARRIEAIRNEGLNATTAIADAIRRSSATFVCVPTPTIAGRIGLENIESAVTELAGCLNAKNEYHLVVIKSTVIPTTTRKVLVPILEKCSGKKVGTDIGVCVNPEFLTEIHSSWTSDRNFARGFLDEALTVIGEWDKKSGDYLADLYKGLNRPMLRTDLATAEMIKYASNCALATRISYWNEIFYVCRLLGIDSDVVAQAAAMDQRIGKYGTVHGKAFGGKCLPKDLAALIHFSKDLGYDSPLLKAVETINERIKADRGVRE
jgi:UDPglucose 6-dehydrogenase